MSRRRPQTSGVQLFPFLDVLLSAMGALILLLAVASRNLSKQEAELAADLPTAEELRVRSEMVEWEIEQRRVQRDKTTGDLADERLKLGHLEQHARQLRDEIGELVRAEEQFSAPEEADDERIAAELRELQSRIAAARHALDETLAENAAKEPSYAIVPYQGPNETRRRPIYIECRATEIVLQPEGVVLTANDLDGPLGPGNPLAAAVRAAREHLSRLRSSSAGDASEPYPLLLVRPDGVESFYAARAALDSWGSEFGYEFIENDWKIDYQLPDAELAAIEQDAVDLARQQQQLVAQLAPRVQRDMTARTYRASKTGGIVAEDGGEMPRGRGFGGGNRPRSLGSDDGYGARRGFSAERSGRDQGTDESWATAAERAGSGRGSAYGSGGYDASADGYGGELVEVGPGYGGGLPSDAPSDRASTLTAPYRAALESARAREAWAASQRGGASGNGRGGDPLTAGGADSKNGSTGNFAGNAAGVANPSTSPGGYLAGNSQNLDASGGSGGASADGNSQNPNTAAADGPNFPASGNGTAAASGGAGSPGAPSPSGTAGATANGTNSIGSAAPAEPGVTPGLSSFGAQFGDSTPQQDQQATQQDRERRRNEAPRGPFDTAGKPQGNYSQSRAGRGGSSSGGGRPSSHRGKNWALPDSGQSAVPLSRPIRVECRDDRITIYSDRGRAATVRVVEFGPNTEDSLNEFVSAIWDHMAGWGIAGDGFYWHPILNLQTVGNGETRASELKALLGDSGLEIRDPRTPAKTVKRAPGNASDSNR